MTRDADGWDDELERLVLSAERVFGGHAVTDAAWRAFHSVVRRSGQALTDEIQGAIEPAADAQASIVSIPKRAWAEALKGELRGLLRVH